MQVYQVNYASSGTLMDIDGIDVSQERTQRLQRDYTERALVLRDWLAWVVDGYL